jgi:hypothetical protein
MGILFGHMRLRDLFFISGVILTACNSRERNPDVVDTTVVDISYQEPLSSEPLFLGDWFTAKCEVLCDVEQGRLLEREKIQKYGQFNSYDLTQTNKPDSAIITFDFIASCCMGFAGGAQVRNDTLILEYQPPIDSLANGCDCLCDYRMTYQIDKKTKAWVGLKTTYKRRF